MTTQQTQTPQQRVAAAEKALGEARARAEYHGWSGAAANAYTAAKREYRAAARAAMTKAARDATEGKGAAAYAIIAGVVVTAIIAVLLLINAAHGGAF